MQSMQKKLMKLCTLLLLFQSHAAVAFYLVKEPSHPLCFIL